ncbi:TraB/GumN family protein [Spiribacter sp. 221]|uniref:TraB/GumN family protein n=1 Tax=Spiribacter onubensis TaxID=3122420 RepID=UPI00349F08AF
MHPAEDTHLIREVMVDDTTIVLLGTAHVSAQSVADVRREIDREDYDAVAVELCESRYQSLTDPAALEKLDLFQVLRSGRAGMVMASLALGAYQQRLADQFDIRPGAELEAAARGARRRRLPLWLIDRDIGTTLKRIYRGVPWWQRPSLFMGLFGSLFSRDEVSAADIEKLKQGDMLEATFSEFAAGSSTLFEPLIAERDRYMAACLLESIEAAETPPRRVLAVVGAGHLAGLEAALNQGITEPRQARESLETIPRPARWPKVIPWVVVVVILAGFAIGFSRSSDLGWQLVTDWVLINGGLCALGAALARGHPFTVIGSFLAAPLTSLNPTIGAGFVAAAIELFSRRPRVEDFRGLRDAVSDWRGWWRNRVARTLLVFLFATIGSAVGTYLAGFRIIEQLV